MEHERFRRIDAAFRAGDLSALRAAVESPDDVPNGTMPLAIGSCLEYAIYHSPLAFVRALLEMGANPRPENHAGFPPLIAAISSGVAHPGARMRPDVGALVSLLLEHGADPEQRGVNDCTALHMAVSARNRSVVQILLAAGADPAARTRIDDLETAREMAERAGLDEIARLIAERERARTGTS